MGLAPYGKPIFKDLIINELISLKDDGSFKINLKYFDYATGFTMTNKKFSKLFGKEIRDKKDKNKPISYEYCIINTKSN